MKPVAKPGIARVTPVRTQMYSLSPTEDSVIKDALAAVVESGGTAGASALVGMTLAGKTGTAQNNAGKNAAGEDLDHGWFVGYAPANDPANPPKIVVALLIEFGLHGSRAARIASSIIGHYLKVPTLLSTWAE